MLLSMSQHIFNMFYHCSTCRNMFNHGETCWKCCDMMNHVATTLFQHEESCFKHMFQHAEPWSYLFKSVFMCFFYQNDVFSCCNMRCMFQHVASRRTIFLKFNRVPKKPRSSGIFPTSLFQHVATRSCCCMLKSMLKHRNFDMFQHV